MKDYGLGYCLAGDRGWKSFGASAVCLLIDGLCGTRKWKNLPKQRKDVIIQAHDLVPSIYAFLKNDELNSEAVIQIQQNHSALN